MTGNDGADTADNRRALRSTSKNGEHADKKTLVPNTTSQTPPSYVSPVFEQAPTMAQELMDVAFHKVGAYVEQGQAQYLRHSSVRWRHMLQTALLPESMA